LKRKQNCPQGGGYSSDLASAGSLHEVAQAIVRKRFHTVIIAAGH
jgi:hypothetical protein